MRVLEARVEVGFVDTYSCVSSEQHKNILMTEDVAKREDNKQEWPPTLNPVEIQSELLSFLNGIFEFAHLLSGKPLIQCSQLNNASQTIHDKLMGYSIKG